MTRPISTQGILVTIKTPGLDSFPGEFYKSFKEELTTVLSKVFTYALTSGDPPKSWSEAIILLLHKEGKDPALCEGYRPVSLLYNGLKILTNILVKRMQKNISNLIKTDKIGFILGATGSK